MVPKEPQPCVEGVKPVQGNGAAERAAYITVYDRRRLDDTGARGSQREGVSKTGF